MTREFGHGGTVYAASRHLGIPPEEILDFSASINPLGPPDGVRNAILRDFDRVIHYPDPEAAELRMALAGRHGLDPENVCPANGSTELIYLLPRLAAGSRVLIVAPCFSEYAASLERGSWDVHYFFLEPSDRFALTLVKLEERLAEGFDLLIVANPGNPTGAVIPQRDIAGLLELCRTSGTIPVIDEAFIDFCESDSALSAVVADGRGLVLRSLTKFYALPGLRIGYAVAAANIIEELAGLIPPWSVGTLSQAAGIAALSDHRYREQTLSVIAAEREFLFNALESSPVLSPYQAAANYLLVRQSSGHSAAELRDMLLSRRILIRDCANFPGLSDRYFRVAIRLRHENEQLLAELSGILSQ